MSRRTGGLVVGILLSVFAIAFQMVGVTAALPRVMRDLGGEAQYAWAFSSFVMGMLLALLVAGRYADRHGPYRPMTVGSALFLAGLGCAALAPNVATLIASRFLQGLGAGALNLSLFVIIALAFPPERRPVVMSMLSFCWVLPAFVGPPVSAVLVEVNWRLVFASAVPLLLLAGALVVPRLKRIQANFTPSADDLPLPVPAVVAVVVSPALLQLTGMLPGAWGLVSGGAGLAGLVLAIPRVLPRRVCSLSPGLGPIVLTRALQAGSFFAAEAFLLLGLQQLGLTSLEAGVALTVGSVGWSLGSWLQAQRWLRLRRDQIITAGTATCAVGMIGIAVVLVWSGIPILVAMIGWTIAGMGMGLMSSSTAVATMALSSDQEQGRNSGALQVAESLGNSVMTAVAGAIHAGLLARGLPSLGWVFAMLLVTVFAAVALSLRIGEVRDVAL